MATTKTSFEPRRSPTYSHCANSSEKWTVWSVWLFAASGVLREVLGQYEIFNIGSFTLHCVDIPVLTSAWAAALCLSNRGIQNRVYTIPVLLITMLISTNATRGLFQYTESTLQWIRFNGGTATVLLLATTCFPSLSVLRETRRAIYVAAIFLSALTVLRLSFGPTLFMIADVSPETVNDGGRPLSAQGTFIVVFCSAILVSDFLRHSKIRLNWRTFFALVMPMVVFATRQGTASIAQIITIAILLAIEKRPGRAWKNALLFCFIASAAIPLVMLLQSTTNNQDLNQRIVNLNTRSAIWDALMIRWPTLPLDIQAFGYPAGGMPPLNIYFKGSYRVWEASIHSMYYGSLPVMGYTGLVSFVFLMIAIALRALRMPFARAHNLPAYPFVLCVSSALLAYSYEVRDYALLGLFVAITCVERDRLNRATRHARTTLIQTFRNG